MSLVLLYYSYTQHIKNFKVLFESKIECGFYLPKIINTNIIIHREDLTVIRHVNNRIYDGMLTC